MAANSSVLKIGDVLGTSMKLYLKNFGTFFGVVLTGYLLYFAYMGITFLSASGTAVSESVLGIISLAVLPAAMILMIAAIAGLNKGISDAYRGAKPSFTACYSAGFKRFFRYMATSIFYTLAMMGGIILLIIPGIVIAVKYSLSLVSSVLDDTNVSHLKYSSNLVKGNGWKIFIIFFLIGIVALIFYGAIFFFAGIDFTAPQSPSFVILQLIMMAVGSVFAPFFLGILVVIYEKLREAKKDEVKPENYKGMSTPAGCAVSGVIYILLIAAIGVGAFFGAKIAKEKGLIPPPPAAGQQIK